ncbi:hypothetical protein D9619_002379 [Psilocybe cf. subviscida]|uniref:WSC domain-containing protein n=1 Tax=Psilocybe cf. subviscida TaxID=2480587 RepID=A0A8H5AYR4_9AGAR|nr:hypothetical protein D9619_002379 [Psilocybe cf. subviscida]
MVFITTVILALSLHLKSAVAMPSGPDLSIRQTAAAVDPNGLPANWTFVGCFSDTAPASRTLQEATVVNTAMTPLLCTQFCSGTNFATPFNFAGTEFTEECFCDFNIQGTAVKLNDSACTFPCGGDGNQTCGDAGKISVYQNMNKNVGPIPTNKANVTGGWTFTGCFTDAINGNGRTLLERFDIAAGVTIESCTAECNATGFTIAGLEFGEECWCGNSFLVANTTAPLTDCSRACEADHTELCGAASRLSVYTLKPPVVTTTAKPTTTVAPTTTVPPTTTATPTTTVKPTTTSVVSPTSVTPTTTPKPTTTAPTTTVAPTTTAKPTTTVA